MKLQMKNISFIFLLAMLFAIACEKEQNNPYLKYGAVPAISKPATKAALVLKEDKAKDIATEIVWSAADFGFDAGISYEVQLDLKGANFKEPITLGIVNALSLTNLTVEKLNTISAGKGLDPDKAADMEIRVIAKINSKVNTLVSTVIPIKVTPYKAALNFPKLQVAGSHQGWNPADNNTVIYSLKSDNKYEGFINFPANTEFKYTVGPSWTLNYGDKGADGTLDKDGDNLKATTAGYYRLRANLNDFSHSVDLTEWGLIGSATANGWDSDQNMTFDAAKSEWVITTGLKAGEIKFRANDAWGMNFGDNGANGSLEYDGANIAIAAEGNYEIRLNLSSPFYTYKITKK